MSERLPNIDIKERLSNVKVEGVYIYPIKSCAGMELRQVEVVETGFKHDRELMLTYPDGQFITQRKTKNKDHKERVKDPTERLALIQPVFVNDNLLRVHAAGMSDLFVQIRNEGESFDARFHDDKPLKAINQGKEASQWFSEFLGFDCQLVAKPNEYIRKLDQRYARESDQTTYADGYPFLMISQEALDDLNQKRLDAGLEYVPMNRFRPNIVVSGSFVDGNLYGEDYLKKIQIGNVSFNIVKPCARCEITAVDQGQGARTKATLGPVASLQFRNGKTPQGSEGAFFGQNMTHDNQGFITLGDRVRVVEINSKPNFNLD